MRLQLANPPSRSDQSPTPSSGAYEASWILRGEEKSMAMEREEPELCKTELGDLVDLAGEERNSTKRLELVAEDHGVIGGGREK
ncbi:hypothetical protein TIFTF001_016176 [Ficus carica]|uniref:Uncharacterized protein n=1 Tax=Ficus carica TaxID=3494 RepID=A0AA88A5U0_FICCA|nr:hypothetical protein TIFTF001_016176 [Ficus carica]